MNLCMLVVVYTNSYLATFVFLNPFKNITLISSLASMHENICVIKRMVWCRSISRIFRRVRAATIPGWIRTLRPLSKRQAFCFTFACILIDSRHEQRSNELAISVETVVNSKTDEYVEYEKKRYLFPMSFFSRMMMECISRRPKTQCSV